MRNSKPEFSLFDFLIVILHYKKVLLFNFLCISILAVIISLLLPKSYKSTVMFMPPGVSNTAGFSALMGNLANVDFTSNRQLSKRQIVSLLYSREIREKLINDFKLIELYKKDKSPNPLDGTLKKLDDNIEIEIEEEGGLGITDVVNVELSVIDKDPKRASEMANALFRMMEEKGKTLNQANLQASKSFYLEQIRECDSILDCHRKKLKDFQLEHKIYNIPDQVSMTMQAVAGAKAELILLQRKKAYVQKMNSSEYSELRSINDKISILNNQISDMENQKHTDILPGLKLSLDLTNTYTDLVKNVEIYVQLYAMLKQQYEYANIRAANEYSGVLVVDAARPAEYKFKPKRVFVVLGIVGFYMSVLLLFLFLRNHFKNLRTKDPESYAKIEKLSRAAKL